MKCQGNDEDELCSLFLPNHIICWSLTVELKRRIVTKDKTEYAIPRMPCVVPSQKEQLVKGPHRGMSQFCVSRNVRSNPIKKRIALHHTLSGCVISIISRIF
ncbi:hypothetical protein CEXT_747931 [Caerostris extrusa]|uniref:Uncharacterized protein n=1 Tax=Caerostris extrusa TaxID=172846 RepID=A0AAV4T3L9_CAEEX|nr:hypothetical protein CEXT_747931 [Caerostris extrusa]